MFLTKTANRENQRKQIDIFIETKMKSYKSKRYSSIRKKHFLRTKSLRNSENRVKLMIIGSESRTISSNARLDDELMCKTAGKLLVELRHPRF